MTPVENPAVQSLEDLVSVEEIEITYRSLAPMEVELDEDPLAFGPKRLNQKTAEVRKLLSQLERSFSEWSRQRAILNRRLTRAQSLIDQKMQDMMEHDPLVRTGSSRADREDYAKLRMRAEVMERTRLEEAIGEVDSLLIVIKAKRNDLKDASGRIKDQLKICQEELGLGARWGSRLPPGIQEVELTPGSRDLSEAEVDTQLEALLQTESVPCTETPAWLRGAEEEVSESPEENTVETVTEYSETAEVREEIEALKILILEDEAEQEASKLLGEIAEGSTIPEVVETVEPLLTVSEKVDTVPEPPEESVSVDSFLDSLLAEPVRTVEAQVPRVTTPVESAELISQIVTPVGPVEIIPQVTTPTEPSVPENSQIEDLFQNAVVPVSSDVVGTHDHSLDSLLLQLGEAKSLDKVSSAVAAFSAFEQNTDDLVSALISE